MAHMFKQEHLNIVWLKDESVFNFCSYPSISSNSELPKFFRLVLELKFFITFAIKDIYHVNCVRSLNIALLYMWKDPNFNKRYIYA